MKKISSFSKAFSLKTISIVLTLCFILTSFAGLSYTVSASSTDYFPEDFAAGDGTEANPYQISNPNQLYKMVDDGGMQSDGTAAHYKLINDIDLNPTDNWEPDYDSNYKVWVDDGEKTFIGVLDGNGYAIKHLYLNGAANSALIVHFDNSAVIKNLTIDSAFSRGTAQAATVAAVVVTTTETPATVNFDNVTVKNATVISGATTYTNIGAGGLVATITNNGAGNYLVVENCKAINVSISKPNKESIASGFLVGLSYINGVGEFVTGSGCVAYGCTGAKAIFGGRYNGNNGHNGTNGVIADYYAGEEYSSGTGTQKDPYHIENEHQLYRMVSENGTKDGVKAYYVLDNDIALNKTDSWTPDATNTKKYRNWNVSASAFAGDFNGRGYTISGLYVNNSENNDAFIKGVSEPAAVSISNVTFKDSYVNAKNLAAVVVCVADSVHFSYVTAINSTLEGGSQSTGTLYAYVNTYNKYVYTTSCSVISSNAAGAIGGASSVERRQVGVGCWAVDCTGTALYTNKKSGSSETNCYLIEDSSTIKGELAKTSMPELDYEYTWNINEDQYPSLIPFRAVSVWDGTQETIETTTMKGEGTEENPYEITNGEQLFAAVNSGDNNLYFEIKNDIYLNDARNLNKNLNWFSNAPIFIGTIDGKGYTIYNLYSDNTTNGNNGYSSSGFIGRLGMNGELKNIDISGAHIYSKQFNVAALVGSIVPTADEEDSYAKPAIISDCSVSNSYVENTNTTNVCTAALVGQILQDTAVGPVTVEIKNCYTAKNTLVSATGTNDNTTAGLIAKAAAYSTDGDQHTITVTDCYTDGNIPFVTMSNKNNRNIDGVYAINLLEDITTMYQVATYSDMTGLFGTDSAWYQANGCAPRLISRTENFKYLDLDCDGIDEPFGADSLVALRNSILGNKGYNLNNAIGNINGDSSEDGTIEDLVDARDLVRLKKIIAGIVEYEKKN